MDWNRTEEPRCLVLVALPAVASARVLELLKEVLPEATVQRTDRSALRFSPILPEGSVLVMPDPLGTRPVAEALRILRQRGVRAPVLLLGLEGPPIIESSRDLGTFDAVPLDALDAFALRRSLEVFAVETLKDRFLEEMASRIRSYERLLEAKDDERLRVFEVASALERQLAEKDEALRALEAGQALGISWDDLPVGSDGSAGEGDTGAFLALSQEIQLVLEAQDAAEEEPGAQVVESIEGSALSLGDVLGDDEIPSSQYIPPEMRSDAQAGGADVQHLETQVAELESERSELTQRLGELRKHSVTRERELRRLRKQSIAAGDLARRLETSERMRSEQTRELLRYQQQVDELEERLEHIASLVSIDPSEAGKDPAELLEVLAERLRRFESEHREQQGTIDMLSRTLAVQQVDDTLDNAQSRRNVLQRVDEALRRTAGSNEPLTALMIGIDDPEEIRRVHGTLLYDFMLVQVAQRLQLSLRRHDVLMRYGDEAFLLLTAATLGDARGQASRLRQAVCGTPIELGSRQVDLSIAIAIVPHTQKIRGANELVRRALRLLMEIRKGSLEQIVSGV